MNPKLVKELSKLIGGLIVLVGALGALGEVMLELLKTFGGGAPALRFADYSLTVLAAAVLAGAVALVLLSDRRRTLLGWWIVLPAAGPLIVGSELLRPRASAPRWWSNAVVIPMFVVVVAWALVTLHGTAVRDVKRLLNKTVLAVAGLGLLIAFVTTGVILTRESGDTKAAASPGAPETTVPTITAVTVSNSLPPPQPTVEVSKGSQFTIPSCTASQCAYVKVSLTNFPPGKHTVTCYADFPSPSRPFESYTTTTTTKPTSMKCVYGYPGAHVWAIVDGEFQSEPYTW